MLKPCQWPLGCKMLTGRPFKHKRFTWYLCAKHRREATRNVAEVKT